MIEYKFKRSTKEFCKHGLVFGEQGLCAGCWEVWHSAQIHEQFEAGNTELTTVGSFGPDEIAAASTRVQQSSLPALIAWGRGHEAGRQSMLMEQARAKKNGN